MKRESGNVLFLILLAVALFAVLSYAITHSSRGLGSIENERDKLETGVAQQCNASVEYGISKLTITQNCAVDEISYELPDGSNQNPKAPISKRCHLFHPSGAGLSPCGLYLQPAPCDLLSLAIGEKCPSSDIVYAGTSGGRRIYASLSDQASGPYSSTGIGSVTTATSASDGLANTNKLVASGDAGSPYTAALTCRSLGEKWYLPSVQEANLLYSVKDIGAFNGTFNSLIAYWTSTETGSSAARKITLSDGEVTGALKADIWRIRCVRRD